MVVWKVILNERSFSMSIAYSADSVNSADSNISAGSIFYGRKKYFRKNIALLKDLSLAVEKASCVDVYSSSGKKAGRAIYDGFNDHRGHDFVPPALYFLAQLKGVDLSIFSDKELLLLGVFCESIEYIFTPATDELFDFIKDNRQRTGFLAKKFFLHTMLNRALSSNKESFIANFNIFAIQDKKEARELSRAIYNFAHMYTQLYSLCKQAKEDGNIDSIFLLIYSIVNSKACLSVGDEGVKDFDSYITEASFAIKELSTIESFNVGSVCKKELVHISPKFTEFSLIANICGVRIISYANTVFLDFCSSEHNFWDVEHSYIAHTDFYFDNF